ncbi:energy transducer TonB [Bradyrhizobium sp. sBnM-33]|uniref:energy transducer TonB family protein n=1 Tax=Bradyrhizobium sp. sBnM-33 TaxID=2831780 RepID=UPI001BCCA1BC|nr:TonB family protein [Bradyrhizobium sp. sBnM-33]WOH51565.1 TonB family protein [Bradyrhizobium sp. sBnM-33]
MLRRISLIALLTTIAMPAVARSETIKEWHKEIIARLDSSKRFPAAASDHRGTAKVGFVLDRNGGLVSRWLEESTGNRALDEESLAIIERAQPFPIPPPNLNEDHLRLAIPFIFANRPGFANQPGPSWEQEEARLRSKVNSICRGC